MAEWLTNHSDKIVAAWTNGVPHYGSVATSRAEGVHFTLKTLLRTRRNTLDVVSDAVLEILQRQAHQLAVDLARDGMSVVPSTMSSTVLNRADDSHPRDFCIKDLFAQLIRRVSRHALLAIVQQVQLARRPGPVATCPGYHHRVIGLPCQHDVRAAIEMRRPLPFLSSRCSGTCGVPKTSSTTHT